MAKERFIVDFMARTAGFRRSIAQVTGDLRRMAGRIARIGGAIAGIAGIGGVAVTLTTVTEKMSELQRIGKLLGTDSSAAKFFDRIAQIRGVELEDIATAITSIRRELGDNNLKPFLEAGLDPEKFKAIESPIELLSTFIRDIRTLRPNKKIAALGKIIGESESEKLAAFFDNPKTSGMEDILKLFERQAQEMKNIGIAGDQTSTGKAMRNDLERLREGWVNLKQPIQEIGTELNRRLIPPVLVILGGVKSWIAEMGGVEGVAKRIEDIFWRLVKIIRDARVEFQNLQAGMSENFMRVLGPRFGQTGKAGDLFNRGDTVFDVLRQQKSQQETDPETKRQTEVLESIDAGVQRWVTVNTGFQ